MPTVDERLGSDEPHREAVTVELSDGDGIELACHDALHPTGLRVTVAREYWSTTTIRVATRGGEIVSEAVVNHADAFQHVDIRLAAAEASRIRDGMRLSTRGGPPLLVYGTAQSEEPRSFAPRLTGDRLADSRLEFLNGFATAASLQAFGWKLGCVLDGLNDLHRSTNESRFAHRERQHLAHYVADGNLAYQDPWGNERRNEIYGIEGLLPLASIARRIDVVTAFELGERYIREVRSAKTGAIKDNAMLSAEGIYTAAYPLALIGELSGRSDWIEDAADQIVVRVKSLHEGESIALRRYDDDRSEFVDWLRSWAWFLLGLARTIPLLPRGRRPELVAELRWGAEEIVKLQRPDGLWHTFVREQETPIETSGSAGVGAALAVAVRNDLLPDSFREPAMRSVRGLLPYVVEEGLLSGASQANKDGERLQRSAYRINSQMGSGLLAQAIAHLDEN